MDIIYLDESIEDTHFVYSALAIPEDSWLAIFGLTKDWRRELRERYGIRIARELHARELVSGKGKLGNKIVTKYHRTIIFKQGLQLLANRGIDLDLYVTNVSLTRSPEESKRDFYTRALNRVINRIQRTLKEQRRYGILIFDEGKEITVRRMIRRMRAWNPIPSRFGAWENGSAYKNIRADRILEDPIFRRSCDSYFIQLVDFIAYALLKQDVEPTPRVRKYRLQNAFTILDPILNKLAAPRDPQGVVRH